MSHNSVEKLVKMANQIGQFFGAQKIGSAAGMADHLRKFWDPHMRAAISEHVKHGGAGLDPIAIEAIKQLDAQEKSQGAA
jgi:formate dehydrogenase subunit delta